MNLLVDSLLTVFGLDGFAGSHLAAADALCNAVLPGDRDSVLLRGLQAFWSRQGRPTSLHAVGVAELLVLAAIVNRAFFRLGGRGLSE